MSVGKDYFPYLSPKPLSEFTPREFKDYVVSLHSVKKKAEPVEISARLTAKGTFSLTTKRKPKWALHSELEKLAAETKQELSEVLNYARKKGYAILNSREESEKLVGTPARSRTNETDNNEINKPIRVSESQAEN